MKTSQLLVGSMCLTTVVLATVILAKRRSQPRPIIPAELRSGNLLREWSSTDFTAIAADAGFSNKIAQIEIVNRGKLNQTQILQLQNTLQNYVLAYHIGSFESFHRFRAPVPEFNLMPSVAEYLKDDLRKSNVTVPDGQEALLKLYWDRYVGKKWENFWMAIALTNAIVEVESTKTNLPSLGDYVHARPNVGLARVGPILEFLVKPESLLQKEGSITYATVSLLLKNSDVTCPVYCRFYWVEAYQRWLPLEQAAAYSGPRKTSLLF